MKSIRKYLLLRLTIGLGGLWLFCGAAAMTALRHVLLSRIDAELRLLASETSLLLPEAAVASTNPRGLARTVNFFVPDSGYYFEAWSEGAIFSDRSPNLGRSHLPHPEKFNGTPAYWNDILATGEKVRICAVRVWVPLSLGRDPKSGFNADIVVAMNREDIERTLGITAMGLIAATIMAAGICFFIVTVAIRRGLIPLDKLAGRVAAARHLEAPADPIPIEAAPREIRPIVQRLNAYVERLAAAYERERSFSSNVAHELRNPIAELKVLAECAMRWPDQLDPGVFKDVMDIVSRLELLVENLLGLARIEGGHPDRGEMRMIDIGMVVNEAWQTLASHAAERSLLVEMTLPDALRLETHEGLFRLIICNLLGNAVEYAAAGGIISIRAEALGSAGVRLQVGNTVQAMRGKDISRFFDRLWRADTARSESSHYGLGLSIAKACAQALDMSLIATLNESGDFLVFRLTTTDYVKPECDSPAVST